MKTLILLRGLPGSGKSSVADVIGHNGCHVSADEFMVNDNGEYEFNANELSYCHKQCADAVKRWMRIGASPIVVANTFVSRWEMDEYFGLAKEFKYRVHTMVVENRHHGKSIHGVPEWKVGDMKQRFSLEL